MGKFILFYLKALLIILIACLIIFFIGILWFGMFFAVEAWL